MSTHPEPAQQRLIAQAWSPPRVPAAGALEVCTIHALDVIANGGDRPRYRAFCHRQLAARRQKLVVGVQCASDGACRIGRDPKTAVRDPRGEVFGSRGSTWRTRVRFRRRGELIVTVMSLATRMRRGLGDPVFSIQYSVFSIQYSVLCDATDY